MNTLSSAGRNRIGDHVIEVRAPRLSDADSWRHTCLEHEKRLRPAFGSPRTDWNDEHSPTVWAAIWWRSRTDPSVQVASVLTVDDGGHDRVVGQQIFAGRDPRTGHTETSTWVAGLPNSHAAAMWMSAVNILEVFEKHPEVTCVVAPLSTTNKAATALATSVGFTYLQTLRQLREFSGAPTDHTIYTLPNTAAVRAKLRKIMQSIPAEEVPPRRGRLPSAKTVAGLLRWGVRRLRNAKPASSQIAVALPARVHEGGCDIVFSPAPQAHYRVIVDGAAIGEVQIHRDEGTSTTEIIDRLRAEAPVEAADAAVVAACRAAVATRDTRRLTIALAKRNSRATRALSELGFVSEGPTLPTLGDETTPRESWTAIRER